MVNYIAEIGINHNGSIDLAYDHINKAAESGATIIKFQTYKAESRSHPGSPIYEILKSCELEFQDFVRLKKHVEGLGLEFSSTPFCLDSAKFLLDINVKYIKIASFHFENSVLLDSRDCNGM